MLAYVQRAKELYYQKRIINEVEYICLIWKGIKDYAREEHVVERATVGFLKLYKENNYLPVRGQSIKEITTFENYKQIGLWPWLKRNDNADVIRESKNESGEREFSVNAPFYDAMVKVCK